MVSFWNRIYAPCKKCGAPGIDADGNRVDDRCPKCGAFRPLAREPEPLLARVLRAIGLRS